MIVARKEGHDYEVERLVQAIVDRLGPALGIERRDLDIEHLLQLGGQGPQGATPDPMEGRARET